MRKLNITLLLLGLAFLGCLVWRIGPGDLWRQVSALGWGVVPIILAEGAANLAHTVGWRHCLGASGPSVPLLRLFRIAMAGYSINYLTPTASVGGEASKVALLATSHPPAATVGSVFLDKLTTAMAHLLLVVPGSLFLLWQGNLPARWWSVMAVLTALVAGGMGVFLVLQRRAKIGGLLRWLADRGLGGQPVRQAARQVSMVDDVLERFYRERPGDLARSVGWHFLGHSAAFAHIWIFLFLLKHPAPLAAVAAAGFFSLWCDLLTFAIPLNLGALEGSRILALRAVGGNAALGLALGMAIRMAQLSWACYGLAACLLLTLRKPVWQPALSATTKIIPTDASCLICMAERKTDG
jgi:glycosyltransferase 2 family protein